MEITEDILEKLRKLKNSQCKKERIHSHALLLLNNGKVSALEAKLKAHGEYEKYRVIQDKLFISDFDKLLLE